MKFKENIPVLPSPLLEKPLHSRNLQKERRDILNAVRNSQILEYCPAAGVVLLIASLITLVIFNLPLPPRMYLKQGPLCAQLGLDQ